jgi:EAL domain-containing protein (putative c-di-GMP-specific phosphodiesterase class I)
MSKVVPISEKFIFAYQPIVRSINQKVVAHELLLRQFNEINTETFLREPQLFCDNLKDLVYSKASTLKHLMLHHNVTTSFVNFTPDQVANDDFIESLSYFYDAGIPPSHIAIEVTEQNYAEDKEAFYAHLGQAKAHGHAIVVDDFGSGVSNFNHVKRLRPSIVKTDKSLLDSALDDEYCLDFLRNLVNFLRQIGCKVVIEGVETHRHLEIANLCNAHYLQGFLFGKPASVCSSEHISLDHLRVMSERLRSLVP